MKAEETPLQAGEKVRLLVDRTFNSGTFLAAGSEHLVGSIQPYPFPAEGGTHQYTVHLHKGGKGRLRPWFPVGPYEVERVDVAEPQPAKPGFNCKAGRDSWENLGMPYLQNESRVADCDLDDHEAAALAKLRAKKIAALPFYLEAPADRRGEVHHFVDSEAIIEKASKVSSADKEIVEKGRGTRKYGLRGIFEFEGKPYAIMGGCYGPEYRVADGWYLLCANDPLAAKVVVTGRLCPETAYHSFRARYKGVEYIMVGPEHQFIFERLKGSYRAVIERMENWRREKSGE